MAAQANVNPGENVQYITKRQLSKNMLYEVVAYQYSDQYPHHPVVLAKIRTKEGKLFKISLPSYVLPFHDPVNELNVESMNDDINVYQQRSFLVLTNGGDPSNYFGTMNQLSRLCLIPSTSELNDMFENGILFSDHGLAHMSHMNEDHQ